MATNHQIEPGVTVEFAITKDGKAYRDTVYLVRRTEHRGSRHTYTLGGQFAWGRPRGASVRNELPSLVTVP